MVSSAVNSAETLYGCPGSRPTTFGTVEVACLLATTRVSGLSSGISVIAVSILSVLAGRYQPCGSLAASTCPVPASAMTNAEACTPGSRGTPGAALTIVPRPDSSDPPMACGRLAVAGAPDRLPEGPPEELPEGPPDGMPDAATAGAATAGAATAGAATAGAATAGAATAGAATAASASRAPATASAARCGIRSGISLRAPVLGGLPNRELTWVNGTNVGIRAPHQRRLRRQPAYGRSE